MSAQPLGPVIDGLGLHVHLEEGELVSGAIVILKVVDTDGDVLLRWIHSHGLAVFERIGMLRTIEQCELTDAAGDSP